MGRTAVWVATAVVFAIFGSLAFVIWFFVTGQGGAP